MKENLMRRGINVDPSRAKCGAETETASYIFLECQNTLNEWVQKFHGSLPFETANIDYSAWLKKILSTCNTEVCEIYVMDLWSIWFNRNKTTYQNDCNTHEKIWNEARGLLKNTKQQCFQEDKK
ncbi:hypothetical protein Ancab_003811 [Ancistrocladus abbreviatus]